MKLKSVLRNLLLSRWYERIPILYAWYEHSIMKEVLKNPIPQHIAIIQDGNRRFAKMIGESTEKGHKYGADATERVLNWCEELGVKQLTLYSFSTENFNRPEGEKKAIFDLMKAKFKETRENPRTHKSRLRVRYMGDIEMLPEDVKKEVLLTDEVTSEYDNMFLNVAIAYGGRQELVDGAKKMARDIQSDVIEPADVNEDMVDDYLYLDKTPKSKVDLIIRTGGDERTSNFLPWQSSGNECGIYICAPFWPEFRKIDFLRAIRTYQIREKEHKIKQAVKVVKLKRHNGGFSKDELKNDLSEALKITLKEAEAIMKNPLVMKEIVKASS
ncbi:di-trans,poly-cis-decaprenylcistransferase [Methanocella sp. CWC-04]|uniref:Tritrans,polycis-undecaprenyl-diphosphate synthase (geranylgeranyl-diphosphate specific) n=1 Tax=Methanooceanicella nereidis TaxID=2052831 RepID=A0AAP2W6R0_9EURY|nr:polyprenyl diphosphate synthase [Methanocella sp. CWC-04]MCD1295557.1 di-trans,poly-cis-decaprenylcistransferase [Methanocella sp. CWC-04]